MKKLLFITSYFPPLGGPGVQRQLYYTKYAEEFGWQPFIITSKNVLYHVYDPSLLEKLPTSTKIIRTESLEFGRILFIFRKIISLFSNNQKADRTKSKVSSRNIHLGRYLRDWFTIIDDRMLWIPFALPVAIRTINKNSIDVIIARGGPFSNTILGLWVAKLTNKPLVLDLADPWIDYPYSNFPTVFHKKINQFFEHRVFKNASLITVACPVIKERILERYKEIDQRWVEVITNGYDPIEFINHLQIKKSNEKFVIAHIGTLSWIRFEAFQVLCKSITKLIESDQKFSDMIELVLIGDVNDESKKLVHDLNLDEVVSFCGYLPHSKAAEKMISANLLFLPVDSVMSNKEGCYVVPGKLYDYVGSSTPILMIGPKNSDAANIIIDNQFGVVFEPNQIDEICTFLLESLQIKKSKSRNINAQKFERKILAEKFYDVLNSAISKPSEN